MSDNNANNKPYAVSVSVRPQKGLKAVNFKGIVFCKNAGEARKKTIDLIMAQDFAKKFNMDKTGIDIKSVALFNDFIIQ